MAGGRNGGLGDWRFEAMTCFWDDEKVLSYNFFSAVTRCDDLPSIRTLNKENR